MQEDRYAWSCIGHEHIQNYLQEVVDNNKVGHAYLFYGLQDVGKRHMAKEFIMSLLCTGEVLPCRECVGCTHFIKNMHPDVHYLVKEEEKKEIGIEQTRKFLSKLQSTPMYKGYTIGIIPDAQLLNDKSANAILKTLEEPKQTVVLVLIAPNKESLVKTLVSRCQHLGFKPVDCTEIEKHLVSLGEEKTHAWNIAALSMGRPGFALQIHKDKEQLEWYMDVSNQCIQMLQEPLLHKRWSVIKDVCKDDKILTILNIWILVLRDIVHIKSNAHQKLVFHGQYDVMQECAHKHTYSALEKYIQGCINSKQEYKYHANMQLVLENIFFTNN